jgi:LmbE family N-acetylglucosaminyl deacetylase
MSAAAAILDRLAARCAVAARIVIIAAHPDDETIGMGAQLCRLENPLLVHVTDGAPRDGREAAAAGFGLPAEYAAVRREELSAALRAGDADHIALSLLGIADQEAVHDLAGLTSLIAELLRSEQPEAVFTHAYEGGHPDHDATAFAVHCACKLLGDAPPIIEMALYHRRNGCFVAGEFLPEPSTPAQPTPRRKPEPIDPQIERLTIGSRLSPGRRSWECRLTERELSRKQQMVNCFATQRRVLAQFDLAAERFRIAPEYDFTQPPHPGPLNYEAWGFGITGAAWRQAAAEALGAMGLSAVQCV